MTAPHRSLRVESFEDRALPSTLYSIGQIERPVASFASHSHLTVSPAQPSRDFGREALDSLVRAFRSQDFHNFGASAFEHAFQWNGRITVFVFVSSSGSDTGSQPITQKPPAETPVSRGQFTSPVVGSSERVPTDGGKATNVSPPAIAIPPNATVVASSLQASTTTTSSGAFPQQVDTQPRINVSIAASRTGLGGPLVFLGEESDEPPLAVEPVPPLPLPIPPQTPAIEEAPATAITVASFASNALSGVLPFNLSALDAGARDILSRVGNLDVELSDNVGGGGEYWWLATAALVTGGVASTIRGNRARWADRRTVGFDSVLAKWGERNGGRFD